MGIASENVAKEYKLSRRVQGEFSAIFFFKRLPLLTRRASSKLKSSLLLPEFIAPKTKVVTEIVSDEGGGIRGGLMLNAEI